MAVIPREHPSAEFQKEFPWVRGGSRVLRILIVEDDSQLAITLKYLVEDNPRYRVVATAADADSAIAAAEEDDPDLVLLDLHLARATTGFPVAVRLNELGVPCLFVSGKAPSFPMPDLALGCLMKPFTAEDVHRSLAMAEDLLRGRETLRPKLPENLTLYDAPTDAASAEPGFIPSKRSLRTRLEHWISGHHH
jgi:DNA-binding NarL/FixJ family response regulator